MTIATYGSQVREKPSTKLPESKATVRANPLVYKCYLPSQAQSKPDFFAGRLAQENPLSDKPLTLLPVVSAAYGWPVTLSDDELLAKLLELNLARSA